MGSLTLDLGGNMTPMGRPRRNADLAVRVTVFLRPDNLESLRRASQREKISLGAVVDRIIDAQRTASRPKEPK